MMRVTLISFVRTIALIFALAAGTASPAMAGGGGGSAPPADDGRHRNLTSSTSYMPLPPLTATVQANRRARGLLQIEAGLEIDNPDLRQRVNRYMPRLRNAYVSALSLYTGVYYQYGDVPDADRIAALLQEATDMTLGETGAEVLLGMIIIHAE